MIDRTSVIAATPDPGGDGMPPAQVQLTQQRVPLSSAADAFATPDAAGRLPIVVMPARAGRVQVELLVVALVVVVVAYLSGRDILMAAGFLVALILTVLGLLRTVLVVVPEGTQAIATQGGRFLRSLGPGLHRVRPTAVVSHLVTTREIPFSAAVMAIPTADDVRVDVSALFTFRIDRPERFVFNTTAPDFDALCQGAVQTAVWTCFRALGSGRIQDHARGDSDELRAKIGELLDPYGVVVTRVLVVRVDPPAEFLASLEGQRLAVVQTAEQEQRFELERRRQSDRNELARLEAQARYEREREAVELAAQVRQRETELEAEREAVRLARLEERLSDSPKAAERDWQTERLAVARALAGNSRAMLTLGSGGSITDALVLSELGPGHPSGQAAVPGSQTDSGPDLDEVP